MFKLRRKTHASCIEGVRNMYRIVVLKPDTTKPFGGTGIDIDVV
jgi:hypothetical protein